ncbi:alpha-galactosidase [Porphyrobacter sp. CACIAM 03H1]|uniref:alpha-galactosidase n=1 Tax=Porphyrobacter sp. CACIAM 03H1 TaxID=2003315 RepID=UPI0015604E2D|nr:alpha-galactosidase [Porphyrobacter sp. CACIAM 03H1]
MEFVRLDGERLTLVFALETGGEADCIYLGARLPGGEDLAMLAATTARGRHESQPDVPPVPGLLPEGKAGWSGTPAVRLSERREDTCVQCATDFRLVAWEQYPDELVLTFYDELLGVDIEQSWRIGASGMVCTEASITNGGGRRLVLDRLSALALPIPHRFTRLTSFTGRWAGEMQEHSRPIAPEGFARTSVAGKPGFAGGNWLILEDPSSGEVLGAHLAWSGDHDTRIDPDMVGSADGRAVLQMGASWDGGEVDLGHEAGYRTPVAMLALAADRSALAQVFHARAILPDRKDWRPRKVHLNSWEALGFNLAESALMRLAEDAASLGIERFVLDDGWFGGRRDDRSSLGDWFVSPDVFPNGLGPLIARVHDLGMDFGLWVEPEMVSPDSDLYRRHPDWCLHTPGRERPAMRGQLALDMAREDVREYLFGRLDALLRENAVAYLKWDHNRDLFPSAPRQTEGFYALLDALRAAHPQVEIESCSSGGGRIDFGVLARTHRVWPSDNNDAIERLRIIPAWSQFLPLEVLGSHVGPSPNPITGRRLSMDFRAKVAVFGHMGVEADPARMSEKERECLAAHIALYKQWRGVLHEGQLHRLAHPDPNVTGMMVTHEGRALALAAQTAFSPVFDAAPLRLAGLDPDARYRVALPDPWPAKARHYLATPDRWREGLTLSGTALMTQGLALPLTHPETAWLIALERLPG